MRAENGSRACAYDTAECLLPSGSAGSCSFTARLRLLNRDRAVWILHTFLSCVIWWFPIRAFGKNLIWLWKSLCYFFVNFSLIFAQIMMYLLMDDVFFTSWASYLNSNTEHANFSQRKCDCPRIIKTYERQTRASYYRQWKLLGEPFLPTQLI